MAYWKDREKTNVDYDESVGERCKMRSKRRHILQGFTGHDERFEFFS